MAARTGLDNRDGESGQSIVEFLLLLPAIVALTVVLFKVNTAIQISIVNQQYARAQALHISYNSPVYPYRGSGNLIQSQFVEKGYNRMVVGISDNSPEGDEDVAGEYIPEASVHMIARNKLKAGSPGQPKEEPAERGFVRVRTTVALCTPSHVISAGKGFVAPTSLTLRDPFDPKAFLFCRSPLDE